MSECIKEGMSDFEKEVQLLSESKRRKIEIKITAKENLPIKADFVLNGVYYSIEGEICSVAKR